MKKIDLSIYKEFKQYFLFYDVVIKGKKSNKELWLENNEISPSSYRRAKNEGNKIGLKILADLNSKFAFKMINDEIVDLFEKRLNEIYFNIYYKKVELYDENIEWINKQLNERYVIYPVLLLFKLLLILNSENDPKKILVEYNNIGNDIQKFKDFYNQDLLEMLEIINISFTNEIDKNVLAFNYKNELSYYTLSSKCILQGMYIESIFFAEKAKEYFIKQENFKRIFYVNLNLMAAYNYLGKYEDCNLLAQKQIIALESYRCYEFEYISAKRHYMVSCLGLKNYNKVIKLLENRQDGLNKTEYCCLLLSKYMSCKKDFNTFYSTLLLEGKFSERDLSFFDLLYRFIYKRDKKIIEEIEKHNITKSVIEIFKKCNF